MSHPVSHFFRPCALLIDGQVLGGAGLGVDTYITTYLHVHRRVDATSWAGFSVAFPFGITKEDDGFGVCHSVNRQNGTIPPADCYKLTIKFPTPLNFDFKVELADENLRNLIPATDRQLSSVSIRLRDYPRVEGFGMPFANRGHPSEGVVNRGECIKGNITLVSMVQRLEFRFIVASHPSILFNHLKTDMPGPFKYPYGKEDYWSVERYDEMMRHTKGHQFRPSWSFDDDDQHLIALTQSQVQDVMWVHKASQKIATFKFRAYFIKPMDCLTADCSLFYAIVPLGQEFLLQHHEAWPILIKSGYLNLRLFDNEDDENPAKWEARTQEASKTLDVMNRHPVNKYDLVLQVRRPQMDNQAFRPDFRVKVFGDRRAADAALKQHIENWTCVSIEFSDLLGDYKRKANAVKCFLPGAQPTNPVACGIPKDVVYKAAKANQRLPISPNLQFTMNLHRDMVRGDGFWKTLVGGNIVNGDQLPMQRRPPPVNLIDISQSHLAALLQEVLPEDRYRFVKYLSELYFGLGLIKAGPGFGKTTALAVATLAMQATVNKVFATAPTNVAADNFAERLDLISRRVTARRNEGRSAHDTTRVRSALILRGYTSSEEVDAFFNTLRDPRLGNEAGPNNKWRTESRWRLYLSPSFWLLMVLRSPAVRPLSADDPLAIHEMQAKMDSKPVYARFRDVATRAITWTQYESGDMVQAVVVVEMFKAILQNADIVCTTPAVSCQKPFVWWKEERARGIAVDEAGNISRPDLYSVWGNTLLPCLLCGDDQQLPPMVMTTDIKDDDGNYLNRLALEGKISALEFFRAKGWPVYRLRTQLRMAVGLFDTCHREVYSDLPFRYGPGSNIVNHRIGQALESYLMRRFPQLKPARAGTLQEVFIHCPGTVCIVNGATKSKSNQQQINRALRFLNDLIKNSGIPASSIAVISPYKANVELFEHCRRTNPQHLTSVADLSPAATVDSFQGREADIMVVILGTTREVGPGFTVDKNRLNVMFSRQKSGLIVFGDLDVLEKVQTASVRGSGRQRSIVTLDGVMHFVKRGMLYNVLRGWFDAGRVVEMRE